MTTVILNSIVANSQKKGMDEYDLEAERQGQAIKGINFLRPAKNFFNKKQRVMPVTIAMKM